ncbi:hypothetical protein A2U01_0022786, partial [Trifolium medium]|nr:hypothetical protein [Trifolium medium]
SNSVKSSCEEEEEANMVYIGQPPIEDKEKLRRKVRGHNAIYLSNNPSYDELREAFDALHEQAFKAFKKLTEKGRLISILELKVSGAQTIRCLKVVHGEVRNIQAKLDKALVPEVTFAIDPKPFDKPMNRPYKKYKF